MMDGQSRVPPSRPVTAWWRRRRRGQVEALFFFVCISPWLVGFVLFKLGPFLASLLLSFVHWEVITKPIWAGLANWQRMLVGDDLFWRSLKVTAIFVGGSVPLSLLLALLLALLLNNSRRWALVFRSIYYLPMMVAGVPLCVLWAWLFNPNLGLFNYLLGLVGVVGPRWLQDARWVLPSLIFMSLWQVGGTMVIFLAGLQGVPAELYEAASLDGAGWGARTLWITIPMISPVFLFNLIMGIIGSFQAFTQGYVMTKGGPGNASLFYVLYLYRNAFEYFRMGYAAALAWFLFVLIALLTVVLFSTVGRSVYYAGRGGL